MHITQINIENLPPLAYEVNLNCDERVNLFIGPNASGKSSILQAMYGLNRAEIVGPELSRSENSIVVSSPDNHGGVPRTFCWLFTSDDWPQSTSRFDPGVIADALPVLYIPATRMSLRGRDIYRFNEIIRKVEDDDVDDPLKALYDTHSGIFYGQYVELAIDRLRKEMDPTPPSPEDRRADWKPIIDRSQQTQFRRALEVGYSCAKSICLEVIHDSVPHVYVEQPDEDDDRFDESGLREGVHYGMGIGTTDNILGDPLYAGALSAGTQGTLLWIYALALKMASHYEWQDGWESNPAILLIDEIENHLHPTWQRRVIPALLEHFPELQIFATTHSPFVVAGLTAGQVHLLERDENGRVTATTNSEDVVGWTADEILRTMMGVVDPTDDATAKAARKLRELRDEGPRDTEEAEEQRQQQMRKLRQQVDRDLLAGGPWKKQRDVRAAVCRRVERVPGVSEPQPRERLAVHAVRRSPEPRLVAELRAANIRWEDLDGASRRRIRDALAEDFGPICAYCERPCQSPMGSDDLSSEASIDHFRPRSGFPDLWLDWLNLGIL